VKAAGKFTIAVVEATVEANYQHTITDSFQYQESHTQYVPFGRVGAFYLQPGYLEISGDSLISTRDTNYAIKNITFELPLAQQYKPEHGGPTVVPVVLWSMDLGDANCNQGRLESAAVSFKPGSPPPPDAVVLEPSGGVK
jgi:hypothetical protein